jgi:hypothetical protein
MNIIRSQSESVKVKETRILLVCTHILLVFYSYVLVCTRVLLVCYSYVLVCTCVLLVCYSYVLVWCFGHDPPDLASWYIVVDSCWSWLYLLCFEIGRHVEWYGAFLLSKFNSYNRTPMIQIEQHLLESSRLICKSIIEIDQYTFKSSKQ